MRQLSFDSIQVTQVVDKSDKLDEQTLKLHGCVCSSPNLEFTSTDPKIVKEHPNFFGKYTYKVSNIIYSFIYYLIIFNTSSI